MKTTKIPWLKSKESDLKCIVLTTNGVVFYSLVSVDNNLPSYIVLGLGPRTRFRFFLEGTPLLSADSKNVEKKFTKTATSIFHAVS